MGHNAPVSGRKKVFPEQGYHPLALPPSPVANGLSPLGMQGPSLVVEEITNDQSNSVCFLLLPSLQQFLAINIATEEC